MSRYSDLKVTLNLGSSVDRGEDDPNFVPRRAGFTPAMTPRPADPGLMTENEHHAVELAGELYDLLASIVGNGPNRSADLAELAAPIHVIQRAVLKQAAARAYPDRYHLLGEVLPE